MLTTPPSHPQAPAAPAALRLTARPGGDTGLFCSLRCQERREKHLARAVVGMARAVDQAERVWLLGFSLTSVWLRTSCFTSHSRVLICEMELTGLLCWNGSQSHWSCTERAQPGLAGGSMLDLSLWPDLRGCCGQVPSLGGSPLPSRWPEHPELAAPSASASRAPPPRGWDSWPVARRLLCPWPWDIEGQGRALASGHLLAPRTL